MLVAGAPQDAVARESVTDPELPGVTLPVGEIDEEPHVDMLAQDQLVLAALISC